MLKLLWTFLFSTLAFAHPVDRAEPEVYVYPASENASSISETDLRHLLASFEMEFAKDFGATPWRFDVTWEQPYIGAGSLYLGGTFRMMLWGGLVRARGMNLGALSAILCHEVGHYLGGAPRQDLGDSSQWASTEGQADHFAATVCLPRIFKVLQTNFPHLVAASEEPAAAIRCAARRPGSASDERSCIWVVTSGLDMIQFLQIYYDRDVPFASPLMRASEQPLQTLINAYPSYQCRMETMMEGGACDQGLSCPRPRCWSTQR